MSAGRIGIDRLAIRLVGLSEAQARALTRHLGPALEARLADLSPEPGAGGRRRLARLDAGTLPVAGEGAALARGAAEAVGRALAARLGENGGGG